jgi:hypothetical protein
MTEGKLPASAASVPPRKNFETPVVPMPVRKGRFCGRVFAIVEVRER